MATITLYSDRDCTQVVGSGIIGEWRDIFGQSPSSTTHSTTVDFDVENQVRFNQIYSFYLSIVKQGNPSEIIIPYTENDIYQDFYITPNCGFSLKCVKDGTASAAITSGRFFVYVNGIRQGLAGSESGVSSTISNDVACKIVIRTGKTAHIDIYGTDIQIDNENFIGFDLITFDSQGRETVNRCFMAVANAEYFIRYEETEPYKPETGNRSKRSGTGTGYYPNNPIPALPTESINAAFSNVLGRGNGLTYYRMDGDCLEKLTEFLYDTTLTLKFRNSEFREAVASIVFIPYNVAADVVNTKRIIYLANRSILPNSACDIITRPFREIDFGVIDLTAANVGYKTFADYTHTGATLYLPAYGTVNIDMSAFVGGLLHLRAVLDVRNGNILYRLESQGSEDDFPTLYGQYTGNCGIPVPIGGANASGNILGAISSIGTVATGLSTGNPLTIVSGVSTIAQQTMPSIDKAGAMQPAAAGIGTPVPVLQIRKKILLNPPKYAELRGKMSAGNDTETQYKLSDFTGYFQAAAVDVSGINGATESEKSEIENILKGGVYL